MSKMLAASFEHLQYQCKNLNWYYYGTMGNLQILAQSHLAPGKRFVFRCALFSLPLIRIDWAELHASVSGFNTKIIVTFICLKNSAGILNFRWKSSLQTLQKQMKKKTTFSSTAEFGVIIIVLPSSSSSSTEKKCVCVCI